MVICPSTRFKLIILWPGMSHLVSRLSQNASYGWGALCHSELRHSFLSLIDCQWLCNIQLKTSRGVLFLPLSDAYVRSFLYLVYTLIKLYYTKGLSDQASSLAPCWNLLLQRPKILASLCRTTTFHYHILVVCWLISVCLCLCIFISEVSLLQET